MASASGACRKFSRIAFRWGSFARNGAVLPLGVLRFVGWKLLFGEEAVRIILSNSARVKGQLGALSRMLC
jgi:hypothetical protein